MRLRGLGLGRVGMKKLKNSHKGGWCANFAHRKGGVRILHKGNVLCEFHTMHYSPAQMRIFVVLSNGKNSWFLKVGNVG